MEQTIRTDMVSVAQGQSVQVQEIMETVCNWQAWNSSGTDDKMKPDIIEAFIAHRDTRRLPVIRFEKVFDYLKDLFPDHKELIENVGF